MKQQFLSNVALLILSVLFSIALIFAFIELPRLLDTLLQNRIGFPQFDHGLGELNALKTEMYIRGLHLRWIGYGSLLLITVLIVAGFATRKTGWALAGAMGLFIPVFGQFALSMFFLAGLGFLRVGWLPFLEITSVNVLDLGRVIYVPYWVLNWFLSLFHWNAHQFLSYLFMAVGAFLFTWGVLVWFQSRYREEQVASSWLYKISRHPQYLGWIIWSYGFILFSPFEETMKVTWSIPGSLPWLLMTMTIIGICMLEEIRMVRVAGTGYEQYRQRAPFLLPIPSWFNRIVSWPARRITGGGYPTRRIQVLWIVLLYTVILMALSLFWLDLRPLRKENAGGAEQTQELSAIAAGLDQAGDDRRAVYAQMEKIPRYGEAGTEVLMTLSGHPNPDVREFSIQFLGEQRCTAAEDIFLGALNDSVRRVRSSAIIASSILTSERAVDSLIGLLVHPLFPNNLFHIYGTLGAMGDARAIPFLAKGLEEEAWFNQRAALNAIMQIDPAAGVAYAIRELNDTDVNVRRNAVMQCILSGDLQVVNPLSDLSEDPDFEVRFYARQGVKRLTK